jgi:hypothetical protein
MLLLCAAAAGLWRTGGGRLFWGLSVLALLWPLAGMHDWLTQSFMMLCIAATATVCADPEGRRWPLLRDTTIGIVALTYLVSAFHKANLTFLHDPIHSCAQEGWRRLAAWWPAPWTDLLAPSWLDPWLGLIIVLVEVALGLALLVAPRLGLTAAALFHASLLVTFEPVFGLVMALGFVCRLGPPPVRWWLRHARPLVWTALFGLAWGAWLAVQPMGALARWDLAPRWALHIVAAMGGLLAWRDPWPCAWGWPLPRRAGRDPAQARPPGILAPSPAPPLALASILALYLTHAMTPYLGHSVQHAGAMLSNLRIDEGCWNHVLVPRRLALHDPYIRIDHARLGEFGDARREALLRATLWSSTALRQIRRNWCVQRYRPFRLEGTHLGATFVLDDLCDPATPLPSGPGVFGGPEWVPGWLRLQKNLPRHCPEACIH